MSDDDEADIAQAAAHADIARHQMEKTKQYLGRGRPYEDMPEKELAELWIAGMQEYARVIHPRPQSLDDASTEFDLRGVEPPYDAVKNETARIYAVAEATFRGMTEDEKEAHSADMVEAYLSERGSRQ